jgi:hypothetical protein
MPSAALSAMMDCMNYLSMSATFLPRKTLSVANIDHNFVSDHEMNFGFCGGVYAVTFARIS